MTPSNLSGLFHGELPLEDYLNAMIAAARSEEKRLAHKRRLRQCAS